MGIYDRDYYRESLPRGGFGHFSAWSISTWLIVINVVVFLLDGMLRRPEGYGYFLGMGPLETWGYFSTATAIGGFQLWRFITFQFLHDSIGHLFWNMLAIFFFGPIVEAHFGPRRYLAFYLICGLGGAVCYVLLSVSGVLGTHPRTPLVGASAGIFGLLIAGAMIAPHVQVFVYFFPMTIRTLAILGMVIALYTILSTGPNAGGEAGHLGGGVLGYLLMKNQHWLNPFAASRPSLASAPFRRRRRRIFQKDWSKDLNR